MSSFKFNARHKATGEMHEVWAMDDYYGRRVYAYIPNILNGEPLKEAEFYNQYETEEAP